MGQIITYFVVGALGCLACAYYCFKIQKTDDVSRRIREELGIKELVCCIAIGSVLLVLMTAAGLFYPSVMETVNTYRDDLMIFCLAGQGVWLLWLGEIKKASGKGRKDERRVRL